MAKYELPYFGKITLSEDDDYHEIEDVAINDCQVSINIDCMGKPLLRLKLLIFKRY